jgi:hypothetical protein
MNKIIVLLFIFSLSIVAQNKERLTVNITKADMGHSFSLLISKKLFSVQLHDLSKVQFNIIDSDTAYGIDGDIPDYELDTIALHIDNVNIPIPKSFYKNFFNPFLMDSGEDKCIDAFFSNDYKTVIVLMNASDAAGAYPLILLLNKNGQHSFIKLTMDDIYFRF